MTVYDGLRLTENLAAEAVRMVSSSLAALCFSVYSLFADR